MTDFILYKLLFPLISGIFGGFYTFTLKYFLNNNEKINNIIFAYLIFFVTNLFTALLLSLYLLFDNSTALILKKNIGSLMNKGFLLATIGILSNVVIYIALTKVDMVEILPKVGIVTYIVATLSALIVLKERFTKLALLGTLIAVIGVYTLFVASK